MTIQRQKKIIKIRMININRSHRHRHRRQLQISVIQMITTIRLRVHWLEIVAAIATDRILRNLGMLDVIGGEAKVVIDAKVQRCAIVGILTTTIIDQCKSLKSHFVQNWTSMLVHIYFFFLAFHIYIQDCSMLSCLKKKNEKKHTKLSDKHKRSKHFTLSI